MNADQAYLFHQTPKDLAKDLLPFVPLAAGDRILEPFRGEGHFYDLFPEPKAWAEIRRGRDYTDVSGTYDWVITNPPFRLETGGKRINAFWLLLDYYTQRVQKGVAFLANDRCFSALTPRRIKVLQERGWSITKIVVCSVKQWRGRYFFVIVQKTATPSVFCLEKTYE